jgi:hypothetical protein
MNCAHCGRKLVAIGAARKNGVKHHDDWGTRRYHKKCFRLLKRAGLIRKGFTSESSANIEPRQRGPF